MTHTEIRIIDAEDLQLYIDCNHNLYKQKWTPITTTLTKRKDAGTYNHDSAAMAFKHLIDTGARKYQSEFPDSSISTDVKIETAESMRDRFEVEYDLGNYKYLVE